MEENYSDLEIYCKLANTFNLIKKLLQERNDLS